MEYKSENGDPVTQDEIDRINEAIYRAKNYGYNLRTVCHRYFMVEKFYPIDFRKSSKNPIQKSKFLILQKCLDTKSCRIQKRSQRT